jgi:hypothetical protein
MQMGNYKLQIISERASQDYCQNNPCTSFKLKPLSMQADPIILIDDEKDDINFLTEALIEL